MFFRSTVATLGVMFAVAVAGQAVFVAVLGESAMRWVLPTNIAAFLFNGYDYYDGSSGTECVDLGNGAVECGGGMAHLSLAFGTTYLARPARHRRGPLRCGRSSAATCPDRRARGHVHRNWAPPGPGVE